MSVTMKDIARKTGLGLATISSYLNGGNVREYNREKIKAAIEELGYEINEIARGLKSNKTRTIGVLVPEVDNIFFMRIVMQIEDTLRKNGYAVILADCRSDIRREKEVIDFFMRRQIDGLINFPVDESGRHLEKFMRTKKPIIVVDRLIKGIECDTILVDNEDASKKAIEYLAKKGHTKIGVLGGPRGIYTAAMRLKGYRRGMLENKLPIQEEYIVCGDYTIESGAKCMRQLMQKGDITAVFATNYEMMVGAMIAINERGVEVPKEISVIGFDNEEFAKATRPGLTLIVQPVKEVADHVARCLLESLVSEKALREVVYLKTTLIEGESVKKLGERE